MKVFVLCEAYPSENNYYAMSFVHPRVKRYMDAGLLVEVISFSTKENYVFDRVQVLNKYTGEKRIRNSNQEIVLISHAPNLKHHLIFLFRNWKFFDKIIFFFHGHETLKIADYYPVPYKYCIVEKKYRRKLLLYDIIKIPLLRYFLRLILKRKDVKLVYVSKWMYHSALKSLGINTIDLSEKVVIINNTISEYIEKTHYSFNNYRADFITIRPLDQSKYAIDLVVDFAKNHPNNTFHIYGKGMYFQYNSLPSNVEIYDTFFEAKDIPELLNSYKYAIMPTRLDAQGVMVCEMAEYGIPVLTSDLPICHEMLDGYENVVFLDNLHFDLDVSQIPSPNKKMKNKFSFNNTVMQEINLIKTLIK